MHGVQPFLVAAAIVTGLAGVADLRTGHIPNKLTLLPLLLAPGAHFAMAASGGLAAGWQAAGLSVVGALVCALTPVFLYWKGTIGGGDVKLLIAIGAICGASVGIEAQFYSFVAGAIMGQAKLAWEGKLFRTLGNAASIVINPFLAPARRRKLSPELMTSMRFGPAIFVGTVTAALFRFV
jgi:prepilin peptidase CpaA